MAGLSDRSSGIGRRDFFKTTMAAAAATTVIGAPFVARAKDEFLMRMGHAEGIGTPITLAFEKWAQVLGEKSGGRIKAQHFPAGQLGNYTQLIEGSRIGTIQATAGGPDTEEAVAPEIAVTGGAPGFIYKDEAHVDKVLQGPIGEEVSKIAREKTGVEFVAWSEVGFRHLLSKRKVTKVEELAGLKIRVPELKVWIGFWQKLGANPTPLAYAEQYNALSTGVIDAVEADFFSIQSFKWFEQAKNLTLTGHWFLPKAVRVNAKWLDSLPADLRDLVRSSAKEVFAEQRKMNREQTGKALEGLKAAGVQVFKMENPEAWLARADAAFKEYGAANPSAKPMIDKILALRG